MIEAAHFTPVGIFRTQKRHKLPTEGAKRWERGVDPTLPAAAADRVAELLVRYGGGTVDDGVTEVGDAPTMPTVEIDAGLPARITGMPIDAATTVDHLRAVGCTVDVQGDRLTVDPATVAPRHQRPATTWSRRSPGSSATRTCRRCCPTPRPAAGSRGCSACAAASAGSSPVPAASR